MLALIVLALSFARPYIQTGQAVAAGTNHRRRGHLDEHVAAGAVRAGAEGGDQHHLVGPGRPAGGGDDVRRPGLAGLAGIIRSRIGPGSGQQPDAGAGGTNYAALLGSAARVMGAAGGTLVLVSDSQQTGWTGEGALPTGVDLKINRRLRSLGERRHRCAQPDGDGVSATLTNYGMRTRNVHASLAIDDRPSSGPGAGAAAAGAAARRRR